MNLFEQNFNKWKNTRYTGLETCVDDLVSLIELLDIKVVASDFDLTMTTVHSGGFVQTDSEKEKLVKNSLTPDWKLFSKKCADRGIVNVVVTFADTKSSSRGIAGENLVKHVLEYNNINYISHVYGYLPSNYQRPEQYKSLGSTTPMEFNKNFHLHQICVDYNVLPSQVLLIDDSYQNCIQAKEKGYYTINVNGNGFSFQNIQTI